MTPTTDEFGHRHARACYWDHLACGWVCADPQPAVVVEAVVGTAAETAPEPVPA